MNNTQYYNTKFVCTYQFHNKELALINPFSRKFIDIKDSTQQPWEFDESEEVVVLSNTLYQNELMNAFSMNTFQADVLKNKIDCLETKLKEIICQCENSESIKADMNHMCTTLAKNVMSPDLSIGFSLLFAYEYFHIMHMCIIDILNTRTVTSENWDALKSSIK